MGTVSQNIRYQETRLQNKQRIEKLRAELAQEEIEAQSARTRLRKLEITVGQNVREFQQLEKRIRTHQMQRKQLAESQEARRQEHTLEMERISQQELEAVAARVHSQEALDVMRRKVALASEHASNKSDPFAKTINRSIRLLQHRVEYA
jgi:hypothetical protein